MQHATNSFGDDLSIVFVMWRPPDTASSCSTLNAFFSFFLVGSVAVLIGFLLLLGGSAVAPIMA